MGSPHPGRGRRLLVAAMLVDTLGGGLIAPFELVYALKVAGLSLTGAGVVLSAAAAAGIVLGPVAGAVSDRLGARATVAVANAVGVGGCAVLLVWPDGWGYGVGAFLLSANMRIFWAAFVPLVTSVADGAQLETWFGRLRGARYIGIVAGEALSSLVFLTGLRTGLRLLVAANGVSFAAALLCVLAAAPSSAGQLRQEREPSGGYRAVLADRINLALAGVNVAATLLAVAPVLALPVYVLDHLHRPAWLPGLLAAALTATASAGLLAGARLIRGRRRLRSLQAAALLWALGCAAFLLGPAGGVAGYGALFAGVLLLGFGEAVYAPTADALPAALAPTQLRGRYAAVHQMAWGISDSIGPVLAAVALAAGNAVLWFTLAGVAAATAGAYRALEHPTRGRDGVSGAELGAQT